MSPSDKDERESSDEGILRCSKKFQDIKSGTIAISQLDIRVAVLRVSVKWARKVKNFQNIPKNPQSSKILITSQNSTSVPARIRSEVSSSENQ